MTFKPKPRPAKLRIKPRPQPAKEIDPLDRMGALLEAGHGTVENARFYVDAFYTNMVARMRGVCEKAEKLKSWDFMVGCYKQATELYVLAAILYEQYPEYPPLMSDGAFDALGKFMYQHWDELDAEFTRWYCVTAMGFSAGTGCEVAERPPITAMLKVIVGDDYYAGQARRLVESGRADGQDKRTFVVKRRPRGKIGGIRKA